MQVGITTACKNLDAGDSWNNIPIQEIIDQFRMTPNPTLIRPIYRTFRTHDSTILIMIGAFFLRLRYINVSAIHDVRLTW
jgi:hypothetical protein